MSLEDVDDHLAVSAVSAAAWFVAVAGRTTAATGSRAVLSIVVAIAAVAAHDRGSTGSCTAAAGASSTTSAVVGTAPVARSGRATTTTAPSEARVGTGVTRRTVTTLTAIRRAASGIGVSVATSAKCATTTATIGNGATGSTTATTVGSNERAEGGVAAVAARSTRKTSAARSNRDRLGPRNSAHEKPLLDKASATATTTDVTGAVIASSTTTAPSTNEKNRSGGGLVPGAGGRKGLNINSRADAHDACVIEGRVSDSCEVTYTGQSGVVEKIVSVLVESVEVRTSVGSVACAGSTVADWNVSAALGVWVQRH